MTTAPGDHNRDSEELQRFLAGDPDALEALPVRLRNQLLSYAAKLDYAQREDIVQQTWLTVMSRGAPFDPRRGNALTYLKQVMRRAARDVRAASGPPAARTRPRRGEEPRFVIVSVDQIIDEGTEDEVTVGETIMDKNVDVEAEAIAKADAEATLALMATTAPTFVYTAMKIVYDAGADIGQAAAAVNVTRFKLRRALNEWRDAYAEHISAA